MNAIEKRISELERLLKRHDPKICICRKADNGSVNVHVDGKTLHFATEAEAHNFMNTMPKTIFVCLWRKNNSEVVSE